ELKNVVERAVHRAGLAAATTPLESVDIDPFDSPWRIAASEGASPEVEETPAPKAPAAALPCDFKALTLRYERDLVEGALAACGGHQGKAAEALSLTYHQFRNLLRKHGVAGKA